MLWTPPAPPFPPPPPPPPPPVVYSTDRSKAVVPVLVLLFIALWFILRGDLLYVFPCVLLFLCFSVLLVLRLPRLGKRELILVLFIRLFDLCLFGFVGFLFLLGSGKDCGLWLWHSLDFSLTFFVIVALPGRFSYFFTLTRNASQETKCSWQGYACREPPVSKNFIARHHRPTSGPLPRTHIQIHYQLDRNSLMKHRYR